MRTTAILLAAGSGRRMGSEMNKVLLPLAGTPIVTRAALALTRSPAIDELVVVARPDELGAVATVLPPLDIPVRIVAGGAERHDSARAGVAAATGDIVLLHDAARPFVTQDLVERVIAGAERHGACIPVVRVVDTLRRVGPDGFARAETVDRTDLVHVQTPQGFRVELVRQALKATPTGAIPTDDAAAVLAQGVAVFTVPGDARNIKITTPADLDAAGPMACCAERA